MMLAEGLPGVMPTAIEIRATDIALGIVEPDGTPVTDESQQR